MLQGRRKISHKEIKQDKLVTVYFNARSWMDNPENRKKVLMGAGVIVVLVVVFFLYTSNRKSKNEEANVKVTNVLSLMQQEKYNEAINGDQTAGIMGLNEIVSNYGSTESGETARFYLANCLLSIKDYDNALKNYNEYSGGNEIIKSACVSGIAAVYEAKGDLKQAAEYYEKAAKVNKELSTNQENLFNAIRNYVQINDKENAKRVYKELKEQYPKSKFLTEIKRYEPEFKN